MVIRDRNKKQRPQPATKTALAMGNPQNVKKTGRSPAAEANRETIFPRFSMASSDHLPGVSLVVFEIFFQAGNSQPITGPGGFKKRNEQAVAWRSLEQLPIFYLCHLRII